ncbi:class I SAM-dependent methyltransferase [Spirosoma daeguense]
MYVSALVRLRKILPSSVYNILKPISKSIQKGYFSFLDGVESLLNLRDPLIPPRTMIFVGHGDFKQTGIEFKSHFIKLAGLKPDERVLDIGCGIGRIAVPLTSYLSNKGSYEGFDIVPYGIEWAQKNITSRHPNFRFQLADIHNDHYNPKGRYQAKEYKFPYPDGSFDFAFLTSVFTHMPKLEVEHYISEISRVLAPNGRALITFFLLNDESRELMKTSDSTHNIQYPDNGRYIAYPDDPEICVGFDESLVKEIFNKNGMEVQVYPGAWCGRKSFTSFQDIVIVRKA